MSYPPFVALLLNHSCSGISSACGRSNLAHSSTTYYAEEITFAIVPMSAVHVSGHPVQVFREPEMLLASSARVMVRFALVSKTWKGHWAV
ncbi:hypothetical protein PLEOSDRAFT_1072096 [Pleurotus ostreatus PC15]|uniref:Uncharacterized protein n=1 Tax=Pleurotus ostreatus (strain PC15) TaxID=1137138 RepID=A0A067NE47_PLEO1|nr:hypothetical protein PLEOSDRAFT_1072096 [Pleurotus ostreatus PC15]